MDVRGGWEEEKVDAVDGEAGLAQSVAETAAERPNSAAIVSSPPSAPLNPKVSSALAT